MMQQLLSDPNQLQDMLSGMVQNPMMSAQLDPNQLGMLMDPNQRSNISNLITGL